MELLAVLDDLADLAVTASLVFLLTLLFLKLVEAMNHTHATPKRHVHCEPVPHAKSLTVPHDQNKSKVGFIIPVQAERKIEEAAIEPVRAVPTVQPVQDTREETERKIEEATIEPVRSVPTVQPTQNIPVQSGTIESEREIDEATIEPVLPVPTVQATQGISPVQAGTRTETERKIEEVMIEPDRSVHMVQPAQRSKLGFICPVQAATCVEPERQIEEATVESVSQSKSAVGSISPVQADTCAGIERKIEEATVSDLDIVIEEEIGEGTTQEFDEKRNAESVEEISVEPSSEIEASVVECGVKENDHDHDDDDDWEGIERSELEKEFMAATEFVAGEENRLGSVGSNERMELYGLHKVATEGPCREPQPMPLKIFARAKWYQIQTYVTPFFRSSVGD